MLPRREPDRPIPRLDFVRLPFSSRFLRVCPVWFAAHPLGVVAAVVASGTAALYAPILAKVVVLSIAASAVSIFAIAAVDRAFGSRSLQARAGWPGLNLILLALVITAHRAWVEPIALDDESLNSGFLRTWGAATIAPLTEVVLLGLGALLIAIAMLPPPRHRPRTAAGPAGPSEPPQPPPEPPSPIPAPAPLRPRAGPAAVEAELTT